MDYARYEQSVAGTLVPTVHNLRAFVPHPLPPKLNLVRLLGAIEAATRRLGELDGVGTMLANPYLLIAPLQQREAVASSAMEGTYTTLSDLALFQAGATDRDKTGETREVLNYVRALSESFNRLGELPLCLRLIREAHAILLADLPPHRGGFVNPGAFKRDQNFIGRPPNARFIPPPPRETLECLDLLERYIQRSNQTDLPQVVDAALIHYQFEAIHPFPDGNGRVGRIMIPLLFVERGVLRRPLLYLSPFFEQHRETYIDLLYEVSAGGAWHEWIAFFCDAVSQSCERTIATITRLQELQAQYRRQLAALRSSAALLETVDWLFERPAFAISELSKKQSITYRTAKLHTEKLMEAGIVQEASGKSRPQYFQASGILNAIGR